MTAGAMALDPADKQRDILWNDSFNTYYDAYFDELLSDTLVNRWMRIDVGVKYLVAITATGSAIAGLALWQEPGWKAAWAALSLIAAAAGIFHSTALVDNLVKEHTRAHKEYAACRSDLENYRHDLNMDPGFDVARKDGEFKALKKKYEDCCGNSPRDWSVSDNLRERVKAQLNETIKDQLETD